MSTWSCTLTTKTYFCCPTLRQVRKRPDCGKDVLVTKWTTWHFYWPFRSKTGEFYQGRQCLDRIRREYLPGRSRLCFPTLSSSNFCLQNDFFLHLIFRVRPICWPWEKSCSLADSLCLVFSGKTVLNKTKFLKTIFIEKKAWVSSKSKIPTHMVVDKKKEVI